MEHAARGRPGAASASGGVAALRQPAQRLAGKPRRGIGIRQRWAASEPRPPNRTFTSANLGTRVGAERAGDGKLSIEVFTIACGTPFAVRLPERAARAVLLPPLLQQGAVASERPAADGGVHPALAVPSLIQVVSTGGTGAFVIGRVDGASNLAADADRVHSCDLYRRRAPGWRDARRRAGLGDDGCGRLLQRRRYRRDARRLRDR